MAKAKQPGGLYVVDGVAVDAAGNPVENAPALEADTPPDKQPGAANLASTPEERIGSAIAAALNPKAAHSVAAPTGTASGSTAPAKVRKPAAPKASGKKKGK